MVRREFGRYINADAMSPGANLRYHGAMAPWGKRMFCCQKEKQEVQPDGSPGSRIVRVVVRRAARHRMDLGRPCRHRARPLRGSRIAAALQVQAPYCRRISTRTPAKKWAPNTAWAFSNGSQRCTFKDGCPCSQFALRWILVCALDQVPRHGLQTLSPPLHKAPAPRKASLIRRLASLPRGFDSENRRPSGFVAGHVFARRLAQMLGVLGHVENIVDNLERQARLGAELSQPPHVVGIGPGVDSASNNAHPDQRARSSRDESLAHFPPSALCARLRGRAPGRRSYLPPCRWLRR